ncbi:MAG: hypothetical protein AAF533_08905 [Acidobacteriota bacterium]
MTKGEAMTQLERLVSGRAWLMKAGALSFVALMLFGCAPVLLLPVEARLSVAYKMKAEEPLSDTSNIQAVMTNGQRSHGEKLTPRLVGSLLLAGSKRLGLNAHLAPTLGGLVLLLSGIAVGHRVTGDRLCGLWVGFTLAGLYVAAACFAMIGPSKPFDGVALGFVGLTAWAMGRSWLLGLSAFLGCWTDERVIMSLSFVALLIHVSSTLAPEEKRVRWLVIVASVAAYVISRAVVHQLLGWETPSTSMMAIKVPETLLSMQVVAWTTLEGAWLPMAVALGLLHRDGKRWQLLILVGLLVGGLGSCVLVLDISRTAAFSFPLLFVAFAVLKERGLELARIRHLGAAAAVMSLLSPNHECVIGFGMRWIPPLPIVSFFLTEQVPS